MNALTSSEMRQWLTCQRGWWLGYYRRLRRRYELAKLPTIGTLYHAGLEQHYRGVDIVPEEFIAQKVAVLYAENPMFTEEIEQAGVYAKIMLEGYFEWLEDTGADSNLEIVGAEVGVSVQVEEFTLNGKIDARVKRRTDGARLQLEHKTVGNFTDLPKWAQQNPQFLTYALLDYMTAEAGEQTDGILLNMAKRVKRTRAAKPPFFDRQEIRFTTDELRAHYLHVAGIGRQIQAARARLDAGEDHHLVCPPNASKAHTWSCPCAPLHSLLDDGSDAEAYLAEHYEEHDPLERYAAPDAEEE